MERSNDTRPSWWRVLTFRRVLLAGVAGVTIAAVVVTAVAVDGDGPAPESDAVAPSTASDPTLGGAAPGPGGGGVELLDPGPLSVRGDAALVWTGREVVVWGGDVEGLPGRARVFADGATYDPQTGRWRTMAPSPLPATPETNSSPIGVWANGEVVLLHDQAAAAWSPDENEWRSLADASGKLVTGAVWTGRELVTVPAFEALDPSSDTWRDLPEPPVELVEATARWTGEEILVVGRQEPLDVFSGDVVGARYDPESDTWRELPPSGVNAQAVDAAWNGRELVVVNYDMSAAAYDPDRDQWRPLAAVPARFQEWVPRVLDFEGRIVVAMGQTVAVLGEEDRWTPLPYGDVPQVPVVAAGGLAYLIGFDYEHDRNVFAVVDPEALVRSAETLQVGSASLTLPPGARLDRARFDRSEVVEGLPPAETVTLDVSTERGLGPVSSTYVGVYGESAIDFVTGGTSLPVTIAPVDGSPPWDGDATPDPDGAILRMDTTSDLVEVSCAQPGAALDLARYLSPPRLRSP